MTEFSKNGTNKSNKIVPLQRNTLSSHDLAFNLIAPPADEKAQAKLSLFGEIKLNEPIRLLIKIEDFEGNVIEQFDPVRERLMHLVLVSNDLYVFDALYPTYRTNGCFAVEATFSKPGSYTLFSCYKPSGQREMISALKLTVSGSTLSPPEISLNHTQVVGNTEIRLRFPQSIVEFGERSKIMFDLWDAANHQPIQDLKPYLGGWANLFIVQRSLDLTGLDYIQAYAVKDATSSRLKFIARFPRSGQYRLWLRFNRSDEIILANFWLNLSNDF